MKTQKLQTLKGRLTPYAFRCGYVEGSHGFVTIAWEHCTYIIRRHPDHGHKIASVCTLKAARKLAADMRREVAQAASLCSVCRRVHGTETIHPCE